MARKFLTAIDLAKNELQNAVVQNLGSAPSAPVKGQIYMDSTGNILYWYNGSGWVAAQGGAGAVPATTVTQSTVSDTSVVGVATTYAREDHKHGREGFGSVTAQTTFGAASSNGASTNVPRADHTHGTPAHDVTAHQFLKLSDFSSPNTSVSFASQKITSLATPTNSTDAANKAYVDSLASGLAWVAPVRATTTANITLSAPQTIDGISIVANDRVLVKNQTLAQENGIYLCAAGAWTRTTDADAASKFPNMSLMVALGTTQADTGWTCTADLPITLNTTPLPFVQFSGTNTVVAGNGLLASGPIFNVINVDGSLTVAADSVSVAYAGTGSATTAARSDHTHSIYTRKYADFAIGGATSQVVTHNLNTRDVTVNVYRNTTPWDTIECDIERTTTQTVTLRFAVAPSASEYTAVVVG